MSLNWRQPIQHVLDQADTETDRKVKWNNFLTQSVRKLNKNSCKNVHNVLRSYDFFFVKSYVDAFSNLSLLKFKVVYCLRLKRCVKKEEKTKLRKNWVLLIYLGLVTGESELHQIPDLIHITVFCINKKSPWWTTLFILGLTVWSRSKVV